MEEVEMHDFNRIQPEDADNFRESTTELGFPDVPKDLSELQAEHKAEIFISLVREQLKLKGPIDKGVYRGMTVDNEGYLYYKHKRVSWKQGTQLKSIKELNRSREGKEFLKMIGYKESEDSSVNTGDLIIEVPEQQSEITRDLETVAPEQAESIKSKIHSFKVTEDWAKKEKEKAMRQLEQSHDENEKKTLNGLITYYEQMELQAKRRYNEVIKNQFQRVNEIISDESRPLGERLKELFRRDGLTIGSIITAIGMTISTIVLALMPSPTPTASSPSPSPAKRFMIKLANWLLDMAKKALAALPGAIGSLIGFLLKKAGELVLFFSEHLIIFFLAFILLIWEFIYVKISNKRQILQS